MHRRAFLAGVAGFLAAPAIVRASSIMPVSVVPMEARAILPLPYGEPSLAMMRLFREVANQKAQYYADLFDNRALGVLT